MQTQTHPTQSNEIKEITVTEQDKNPSQGHNRDTNQDTQVSEDLARKQLLAEQNDYFREHCKPVNIRGEIYVTRGVHDMGFEAMSTILLAVAQFNNFTEDNDPMGLHDFGSFDMFGKTFFWKIDYYDSNKEYGSEDPTDPEKTFRVLTVMLAEEY